MKVRPSIKILQSQGLGSRKECEKIFWESEIFLQGIRLNPETDEISLGDSILIDGKLYEIRPFVYLILNKPEGFETSHKPSAHPSVFDLLPRHYLARGIQAAGRLDQDTSGALLFSDDGQFIHRAISGKSGEKHQIEKIYEIKGANAFDHTQVKQLLAGVDLHDEPEPVAASRAEIQSNGSLLMGITTGKYHQVKRMIAAVGNHVEGLHRISVGPYILPNHLEQGQFIEIDPGLLSIQSAE